MAVTCSAISTCVLDSIHIQHARDAGSPLLAPAGSGGDLRVRCDDGQHSIHSAINTIGMQYHPPIAMQGSA